jgi:hypothetical protein
MLRVFWHFRFIVFRPLLCCNIFNRDYFLPDVKLIEDGTSGQLREKLHNLFNKKILVWFERDSLDLVNNWRISKLLISMKNSLINMQYF